MNLNHFASRLAVALSCLLSAQALWAQALPTDTTIRKATLANGLTYYIKHNAQTPGQADFYLANKAGSLLEDADQRGLAHFLEHMAFNGTEHFPYGNGDPGSIRLWCEKKGIKFGADLNASTSVDRTIYNMSNVPVSKAGVTDTCLLILRDWAAGMLLRPDEIDRERGVIHEEWRTRRSNFASTRMMEDALPVVYAGSKYADCLPIGNIEIVDTFPREALVRYYEKWYRPDMQAVIVVGDIDIDKVESQIRSLFSDIPAHQSAHGSLDFDVPDNDVMIVYSQADAEQPTLNLSLYMKRDAAPADSVDRLSAYADGYKSRMAMFILRQRLQQLTKQAPATLMTVGCRDNMFYISKEKDAFALNVGLLPYNPKGGIDAAIEVVEKARRYGFTEDELGHAKDQHAVSVEHDLDNKDNTRNATYVKAIIENFIDGAPLLDITDKAAIEASLAETVTLDDVNRAIRDIVTDSNQVCVVFGPATYGDEIYSMPSKDELRSWIEEAQRREYANDFASDFDGDLNFIKEQPEPGKIVARRATANGYTEYLLSNGIRVHARQSGIEPNRLTINMVRHGGRSMFTDADAANLVLAAGVVRESGAADFDYLTLEKKRRGKALRVTPYIDMEEEGVKGVCAATDFRPWLEIMYLYMTQPRRDEAIFNATIERQRSLLKNRTASPNVVYNDSLRQAIYGDSRLARPLREEDIADISLDRIYEIYGERFADLSGMNLIVTGDIRTDEFDDLICRYVASLPGKKPTNAEIKAFNNGDSDFVSGVPGPNLPDIRKVNESRVFNYTRSTPIATTTIIYSAPIEYTADNDLKADVLSQILRAIYTETVREQEGGTYGVSVNSMFWHYPEDGCSLTINFRCAPHEYDRLVNIVEERIRLMAQDGPTESELDRVKEYEIKNYDRAVLTNGWWEYVRTHEVLDAIDFDNDYVEKVKQLTVGDIRDFCRELLSSNCRIQVTMK